MRLVRRERILPDSPTIFLLHGWGSDADDLFGMAAPLPIARSIVALQAPDRHPGGAGWSWFDIGWTERGVSLDVAGARERMELLVAAFEEYPRPWTVVGFSQGAMMAALLLAERPEYVDAAVLVAGMLLPGVEPVAGPRRPALVTHGRTDEVVPYGERHEVRLVPDPGGHSVSMAQILAIGEFLPRPLAADDLGGR